MGGGGGLEKGECTIKVNEFCCSKKKKERKEKRKKARVICSPSPSPASEVR